MSELLKKTIMLLMLVQHHILYKQLEDKELMSLWTASDGNETIQDLTHQLYDIKKIGRIIKDEAQTRETEQETK